MNIKELAYSQFIDTNLNRYDVFVRCLAIDNYFKRNLNGFDLYNKMQRLRKADVDSYDWEGKFKNVIKDIHENGYNDEYPLIMSNGFVDDGAHRFSYMLNEGFDNIPIETKNDPERTTNYRKAWFDEHFTKKEVEQIEAKRIEIFDRFGFFTIFILWNPVEPYFDAIEAGIATNHKILESRTVEMDLDFIRKSYSCDDILPWKVEKKIQYMTGRDTTKIRLLILDMPNPKWRYKAATGNPLSTVGEQLKLKIRADCKPKVQNYFHDIIVHTSDNFEQADFIRKCIDETYPKS